MSNRLASDNASHFHLDMNYPHIIQSFTFRFKTMEEAKALAHSIATRCDIHAKKVELGLNELFLNAIEHGNLSINQAEKAKLKLDNNWHSEVEKRLNYPQYSIKDVEVQVDFSPDLIRIIITDQGNGFDWQAFEKNPFAVSRAYNGRGLLVARSMCFDEMTFSTKGNAVHCAVYR